MTRYLHIAATAGHRLVRLGRRVNRGTASVFATLTYGATFVLVSLCAATMLVVFVAVTLVAVGVTVRTWRDTGVSFNGAAVTVLGICLGLVVYAARCLTARREVLHYDLQRPWLPTVEQAQADERLRQQVQRYAAQKRRTHAVTTGEHAAIGGDL